MPAGFAMGRLAMRPGRNEIGALVWLGTCAPLRYRLSLLRMIVGLAAFMFGLGRMKRYR
jgi:hypothetical protein